MSSAGIRQIRLGAMDAAVAKVLEGLADTDAVARMWAKDHTLWAADPTEISDRLGWLEVPAEMSGAVEQLDAFVDGCLADGLTDVVVMGMGG